MRSYDVLLATAPGQPEGTLIYIVDKSDLYIRVRDGIRQVMVRVSKIKLWCDFFSFTYKVEQYFFDTHLSPKFFLLPAGRLQPFLQRFGK